MSDAQLQAAAILKALHQKWTPHEAQKALIRAVFKHKHDIVQLDSGRKFGKALCIRTPIPTPSGWTAMGDLKDGDIIFDECGIQCKVVKAHPVTFNLKAYRVHFSDGTFIDACEDHLWTVEDKQFRKSKQRTTNSRYGPKTLRTKDMLDSLKYRDEWNYSIPLTGPLRIDKRDDLPIEPYLLGAWLGDGSAAHGRIWSADEEIYDYIKMLGYEVTTSDKDPLYHGIPGLKSKLSAAGLLNNKHMPKSYLRGSEGQRWELLQGLMDTDGTIGLNGMACFDNTNVKLADAVEELVRSLGMKPNRAMKDTGHKPCHRVWFTPHGPVFGLPRKRERIGARVRKPKHRFIVDIEPIDSVPMRCITVDSPSQLYLAGKQMVPTHNTDWLIYVLCRWAHFRVGEYYYLTPKQKQAREIMWVPGRLQTFMPPEFVKKIDNVEMRVTFHNGSTIKLDGSDNYDVYRGINPHGIAYDEFKDFKPEFHEAMEPNLATHKAQLIIAGTPPDESEIPDECEDPDEIAAMMHQYDIMAKICQEQDNCSYWSFPSWANPHISREWLSKRRDMLFARGEHHIWYREYEAKRVTGGRANIFPMFERKKHVYPHEEVMNEVRRDFSKLHFYITADPGTSTCFAMLFTAINPYTQKRYDLSELYIRDNAKTSTAQMIPLKRNLARELFQHMDTYQLYDEAAAWFAAEAMHSFQDAWIPTEKRKYDKSAGLSLIKDQLNYNMIMVSDRCKFLAWELENHKADKHGRPEKVNDHLIDCLRYSNEAACISLREMREPHKPRSERRAYSLAEDLDATPAAEDQRLERDYPTYLESSETSWHDD